MELTVATCIPLRASADRKLNELLLVIPIRCGEASYREENTKMKLSDVMSPPPASGKHENYQLHKLGDSQVGYVQWYYLEVMNSCRLPSPLRCSEMRAAEQKHGCRYVPATKAQWSVLRTGGLFGVTKAEKHEFLE